MHLSEPLERRVFLSASLKSGVLKVNGSNGSDTISISLRNHKYTVSINSLTTNFNPKLVHSLTVRGNNGNDRITLSGPIKATTTINAGEGNDIVQGSNAAEQIVGGS